MLCSSSRSMKFISFLSLEYISKIFIRSPLPLIFHAKYGGELYALTIQAQKHNHSTTVNRSIALARNHKLIAENNVANTFVCHRSSFELRSQENLDLTSSASY